MGVVSDLWGGVVRRGKEYREGKGKGWFYFVYAGGVVVG